jgi:hypothetical protein
MRGATFTGGEFQEVTMVNKLTRLGRTRFVGDSRTNLVHDRWHPDCQGCGLDEAVRSGHAVGFKPDTLNGALWAGYEYCEACLDRSEPSPPRWAMEKTAPEMADPEREHGVQAATPKASDREREALRREVFASSRER